VLRLTSLPRSDQRGKGRTQGDELRLSQISEGLDSPGALISSPCILQTRQQVFHNTGSTYLCAGIQDTPHEENGTRLDVANQEDEGAVYGDFDWLGGH